MIGSRLHHVTVMSTDVERSIRFYSSALGLKKLLRPPFPNEGAWLGAGDYMVHLNLNPGGTFRARRVIDGNDVHFAIRLEDFESAVAHLKTAGFRETEDESDPRRMVVKRTGPAGFPQAYVMDPDGNVIEINAAR
jgi:glyoxylase I family protein